MVGEHPRYGYRRIWALLRKAGWTVNRKRIYRLWRQEGLKVPQKQHKKRRLGHSANSCVRRKAEYKDHVWTWDFVHDRTTNGRPLKWLSIVDEYTRECLALEVDRGITAERVIDVLADLFRIRGVPKHIRSDNGPEFIAKAIRRWLGHGGRGDALRRAGLAVGERLRRVVPQPPARRADQPRGVRKPGRGQAPGRRLATGLQPPATSQFAGISDPGGVCRRLCCCGLRYAQPAAAQPKPW